MGDIVSVTDIGGDIFYAQLRGFLTDQYGEKSGVIRYLQVEKYIENPMGFYTGATNHPSAPSRMIFFSPS